MEDGLCYIQYNANTIYAFPSLSCTEGHNLPSYTSTTRQTYYIYQGKYILSNSETVNCSTNCPYRTYIAHISSNQEHYGLDINYLILPATLIVLVFCSVIYRWFIRLRG